LIEDDNKAELLTKIKRSRLTLLHVSLRKGIISARIDHYLISLLILYGCNNYDIISVIIWLIEIKYKEEVEELVFLYTRKMVFF